MRKLLSLLHTYSRRVILSAASGLETGKSTILISSQKQTDVKRKKDANARTVNVEGGKRQAGWNSRGAVDLVLKGKIDTSCHSVRPRDPRHESVNTADCFRVSDDSRMGNC